MKKLLVIRFSSLGDVAISVPLLKALAKKYPDTEVTMLSKASQSPFFEDFPENFHFHAAYTHSKHKGLKGIFRLYGELKKYRFDVVADLHDSLRSDILCMLLGFLGGIPYFRIDKGRKEKEKLTRKNKVLKPLRKMYLRYADVFRKAGYPLDYSDITLPETDCPSNLEYFESIYGEKVGKWIGIAPFAGHEWKVYPFDKMEKVIAHFANDSKYKVFIFGGGNREIDIMKKWQSDYPQIIIPSGGDLAVDLKLISCLDLMLSMDSANMHLASLKGIPVISVWGATHPYAGFYGIFLNEDDAIQIEMDCRPCSVYGKKPCYRKDFACMNNISPEMIISKIEKKLDV